MREVAREPCSGRLQGAPLRLPLRYTARIVLAKGAKLPKDKLLYPGMPAEVLIVTGERTALSYLVEPITRSLNRSLREN